MDGSNKSVGLDNVNAGVGQNKFDPGDVYSVGDRNSDDGGIDGVDTISNHPIKSQS